MSDAERAVELNAGDKAEPANPPKVTLTGAFATCDAMNAWVVYVVLSELRFNVFATAPYPGATDIDAVYGNCGG